MAAAVAVLAAVVVLVAVLTADDGNDAVSVASDASTSTSLSVGEDPSTSSSLVAVAPTLAPGATTSTIRRSAAAPGSVAPASQAPATTAPARCSRPTAGSDFDGFGSTEIVIENPEGSHRSCVLTADTTAQQERGLSRQNDLDGYDGMIFRFPAAEERGFWMRNTSIPLSIAFFDASGAFVSATDMEPCGDSPQCPGYRSNGPAKYALEVIKGRLPAVGATTGSRLTG